MFHHHRLFFKLFLVIYGGFLFAHVWEMGFSSWKLLAVMLGGLALALLAHKKHGYLPSIFLVGHMVLEWYHHGTHGNHYDEGDVAFHGIHALLDLTFLFIEAQEHFGKYATLFLCVVVLSLAGIFIYNFTPTPQLAPSSLHTQILELHAEHYSHSGGILHFAVIGGMLGCVLSHLFLAPRWKHIH